MYKDTRNVYKNLVRNHKGNMFRIVFWDVLPSDDNHFTRQYIQEDNSEHHTRRSDNLKSHIKERYHSWLFNTPSRGPSSYLNYLKTSTLETLAR
jgi:hypothetical protein